MRYLFTAMLLTFCLCVPVSADDEINLDYFFLYDGGVFIHQSGKPIEAFEYFTVPVMKPYTNAVHKGDMTSDGSLVCVLRGDQSNEGRYDLVRVDPDSSITPLFGLITSEQKSENEKLTRSFGEISIDQISHNVVFAVNERIAEIGKPLEAKYSSTIYRMPVKGGIIEKIGAFDKVVVDISAAGGTVAVIVSEDSETYVFLKVPDSTEWTLKEFRLMSALSVDISPDCSSILLFGEQLRNTEIVMLIEVRSFGETSFEMELLGEFSSKQAGVNYKYSIDGKSIIYMDKHTLVWGDTWVNYMMTGDTVYPLVRDDFGLSYNPVKKRDVRSSEITRQTATMMPDIRTFGSDGIWSLAGTEAGDMSVVCSIEPDGTSAEILGFDQDAKEILRSENASDKLLGVFRTDGSTFQVENLELGEKLLSFESMPYGRLTEIIPEGERIAHELHLAWNIGGKMLGIEIPEHSMCIGGDDKYLHLVLNRRHKGAFCPAGYVTPFYLLDRSNWTIEHPRYFGDAKTTIGFHTRSFSDKIGNLYILDNLASRVYKYESGRRWEIGWLPDGLPQIAYPSDMAFLDGNIYVLDQLNHRIVEYSPDGDPVSIISLEPNMQLQSKRMKFIEITDKSIRLADLDTHVIMDFTLSN